MNRVAIIRILKTIEVYATNEFDGVYQSAVVLDKLLDELKIAIHCDECCRASEELDNDSVCR